MYDTCPHVVVPQLHTLEAKNRQHFIGPIEGHHCTSIQVLSLSQYPRILALL